MSDSHKSLQRLKNETTMLVIGTVLGLTSVFGIASSLDNNSASADNVPSAPAAVTSLEIAPATISEP